MMKKFLIIKNNRIMSVMVCQNESVLVLKDGEQLVDVTSENKSFKKGDKYKSLWGRLWGT
jgi:hypothetical protein